MTLEQAKKRLEVLSNRQDPLLNAFYGGRVGFRKYKKKDFQRMDRELSEAVEVSRLREFIEMEERKSYNKANPKPSPYCESLDEIIAGTYRTDAIYGRVLVIRKNKSTVTIQTQSGYTETRKPNLIFKQHKP